MRSYCAGRSSNEPREADLTGDVRSFFHINVNSTDFDRSLEFYRLLGFEVVKDFAAAGETDFHKAGLGPVLDLPADAVAGRAVLMKLKEDDAGPRIDLIEWTGPKPEPHAPRLMSDPGVARICLRTSDAAAVHARLASAGFSTYTRPTDITLGGSVMKIFCAEDPDGVVFEFMQFIRPA